MSQALYRKWRPSNWDEIVGQQHVVRTLRNAVATDRIAHAYLFAGARGTGKTTVARLLAKAANCLDPDPGKRPCNQCEHCKAVNENRFMDLIEIDAASQNGVDEVRDLRDKIGFTPNQGKYKIYIIDEVHMFSTSAFNALLKTLEEPPPHAIFILATTEIHKIPATVLSRCQRHEFRRLPVDEIVAQLEQIAKAEKMKASPEALILIARQSTGSLRDAISLLDQLASTGREISVELVQNVLGTATSRTVLDLAQAIQDRDAAAGLNALHAALDSGNDARTLARQVVDYLRSLLLIQMGDRAQVDLAADALAQAESQAHAFSQADVLRMVRSFNAAASEQRGNWQPALPLELALAEAIEGPAGTPTAGTPPTEKKAPAAARVETSPLSPGTDEKKPEDAAGGVTLDQVAKGWKQFCSVLPKGPLQGALNSGHPIELKKGTLTLGFASEVVRSKVEIPNGIETIQKAISQVFGVDLAIKCVVSNAKHPIPPDVKADGMVAAAIKKGGEIVDIQD